jgi:hypothetical protein
MIFCRFKSLRETLKSVLTIFAQFPKLNVVEHQCDKRRLSALIVLVSAIEVANAI